MKALVTTDLYTTRTNGVVTAVRNLMEEPEKKNRAKQPGRAAFCGTPRLFSGCIALTA